MTEIPKAYEPQSVESKWYQFWLDRKCFVADPARVTEKRPAYSIVIPPPNVTGVLHMGHVLNNTVQDILARKARMDGKEVLWLPGTDHAGIATEGMVSKQIWKEEKKSKRDLGREEFIKRVWAWKEKHGGIIIAQLKKLGCSCDWTRERFTMDPEYVRNVQRVFVDLYKKGLIYRGKRMVNWCPATQTALSDEEVEMEAQKGFLYYFKVEVVEVVGQASRLSQTSEEKDGDGRDAGRTLEGIRSTGAWLTIATTRPETIPGDTAVAVNPKDKRYAHLIGKHVIRPLPAQLPSGKKLIPIIGDEYVDFEFGTGVLKVTPAHDKNDFAIGQRHNLAAVDIMNPDGTMNDSAGESLAGLDRFEARAVAVERLKELNALVKEDPYENKIGFSQRAHVPIEPRLSEQWFLKYPSVEQSKACVEQEGSAPAAGVAARALAGSTEHVEESGAVKSFAGPGAADGASGAGPEAGALPKMRFHPQRWAKVYDHWLTNIQDWCISRQLWWGHRVPVWRKSAEVRRLFSDKLPNLGPEEASFSGIGRELSYVSQRVCDENKDVIKVTSEVATASEAEATKLHEMGYAQDPDVLDTWASSWLWPFATMGWTGDKTLDSKNPTLQAFYPTTDLVTAPEIIFFWVARMIMAGFEYMGEMPFRNVYFTGIIRDKLGRKMSKSLGNSPDPLDLIAKYGADAVRFGTMRSAPLGQDVMFDEKDVELGRNFCNKLWNACRFRQMQGSAGASPAREGASPEQSEIEGEIDPRLLTNDDKWILLKLDQAIREIDAAFAEYKFNEVTQTLYRFFWSEYCDWYVEASKAVLARTATSGVTELQGYKVTTEADVTMKPCNDVTGEALRANTLAVIDFVLSNTLRLFHPFLPFITEELWHGLGYNRDLPADQGGDTIMFAHWPKPFDADFKEHYGLDDCYLEFVDTKFELVTLGRNLRRENNIASNKKVKFILKPSDGLPPHDVEVLKILLNAEPLILDANYEPPKGTPSVHSKLGELYLPLEGLRDVAGEKARLQKELVKIDTEIQKVEQKLNNSAFVQNAPPVVLAENQQRLADWQAKRARVEASLNSFES